MRPLTILLLTLTTSACGGAEISPPPPSPPPAHPDHMASMGDHMASMAKQRDRLREALGEAYDAPVPGLDAADVAHGSQLFQTSCALCHGPAGKGDGPAGVALSPPPADLTDTPHARFYSDAGRVRIVTEGSPGTGMAGFQDRLSPSEILDVYAYVATLRGDEPAGEAHEHSHRHDDE